MDTIYRIYLILLKWRTLKKPRRNRYAEQR